MNEAEPGRFVDAGGMIFDMASVATIARSLRVLELAGNGITTVAHLCYLGNLQEVVLSNNAIADKQDLAQMLSGYQFLQKLDLSGNPIAEPKPAAGGGRSVGGRAGVGPSYRDEVVLMSQTLSVLDGKEITMQQRRFLQDREMMRQRRRQAKAAAKAGGGAKAGAGEAARGGMGMGNVEVGAGKENDGAEHAPGFSVGLGV